MADAITKFGCDNTQFVNVVAQQPGMRVIRIRENYSSASPSTTDLLVQQPAGSAASAPVLQGDTYMFTPRNGANCFVQGEIVGAVQAVNVGPIFILQIESQQ